MIKSTPAFRLKALMLLIVIITGCTACTFSFNPDPVIPDPDPINGPDMTVFDPYFPIGQEEEMLGRLLELREKTQDAAGWIRVPGTDIDFPIVQGSDNAYYLKHDHLGKSTRYGAIFMDYRNRPLQGDRNTIIYGHNMKDDKMFGKLMPFKDEDFALTHPYIELVTDKGYSVWRIFSAHVTSRDFYYIYVNFSSDEKYMDFLTALQEKSMHDFNLQMYPEDRILTLSTCSYEFKNAFFPMHAVLVYEYAFPVDSNHSNNP
jgi:sortase B